MILICVFLFRAFSTNGPQPPEVVRYEDSETCTCLSSPSSPDLRSPGLRDAERSPAGSIPVDGSWPNGRKARTASDRSGRRVHPELRGAPEQRWPRTHRSRDDDTQVIA